MNTALCILNLSDPKGRLLPDLGANAATLAKPISSPEETPQGGTLVLYIVGHGRKNRLFGPGGAILEEKDVAETIQRLRGTDPTLIVWDVCFAESMKSIPATNDWPANFVHIFSCRSFERTWHGPLPPNGNGVTLFSTELRSAIAALAPTFSWGELQDKLQAAFVSVQSGTTSSSLQKPSIHPDNTTHKPSTFELAQLIGGPSQPVSPTPSFSPKANPLPTFAAVDQNPLDPPPVATHKPRHGLSDLRGIEKAATNPPDEARFGKIFDLPPLGDDAPSPQDLGLPGGPMDRGTERNSSETMFALMTYFGQFLNHDISFDPTSSVEQQQDAPATRNFRTPALELDNLYGAGPVASPLFYDQTRPNKLLLGRAIDVPAESDIPADVDVPRNSQGTAIIGDPRNDDNLIISQLHVAFIKFHNTIVDRLNSIDDGYKVKGASDFEKAQRLVRWHYQWLVLNEFLPAVVGKETLSPVLNGEPLLYTTQKAFIPVEFSVAAFRFGHSMVQPRYVINDGFRSVVFSSTPNAWPTNGAPRTDLRGGPIRYRERINWKNFYNTGAPRSPGADTTPFASKIAAQLSSPLLNLPPSFARGNVAPGPLSLAEMNLRRGRKLGLPSGQDVAKEVVARLKNVPNLRALEETEIWAHPDLQKFRGRPAPLWYYFLREAEVRAGGEHLGPIGGRIVAEVIVGLLDLDKSSYRSLVPTWKPPLADPKTSQFTFTDFFRVAGVDFQ
jgi:hypothetical protein